MALLQKHMTESYGVAYVSRIDKIIGLFSEHRIFYRALFAKETYDLVDPTDQSPLSLV